MFKCCVSERARMKCAATRFLRRFINYYYERQQKTKKKKIINNGKGASERASTSMCIHVCVCVRVIINAYVRRDGKKTKTMNPSRDEKVRRSRSAVTTTYMCSIRGARACVVIVKKMPCFGGGSRVTLVLLFFKTKKNRVSLFVLPNTGARSVRL